MAACALYRRIYETKKGFFSPGPASIEIGDGSHIFSRMDGDDSWPLMGETYLHGFMDGWMDGWRAQGQGEPGKRCIKCH